MADSRWHIKYPEPWEYLYRVSKQAGLTDAHARLLADYAVANGVRPDTIGKARSAWSEFLTSEWYEGARNWQHQGEPDDPTGTLLPHTNDPDLISRDDEVKGTASLVRDDPESPFAGIGGNIPDTDLVAATLEATDEDRAENATLLPGTNALTANQTLLAGLIAAGDKGAVAPEDIPRDIELAAARGDTVAIAAREALLTGTEAQDEFEDTFSFDIASYAETMRRINRETGTPQDYVALVPQPDGTILEVEPRYDITRDSWNLFTVMGRQEIIALQVKMVKADLLTLEDMTYTWGEWQAESAFAMAAVLQSANFTGNDWQTELTNTIEDTETGLSKAADTDRARAFAEDVFRPMDYATITQLVKDEVESFAGRKPHDWEMQLLADELKSNYRSEFDANQAAARANFDSLEQTRLSINDDEDPFALEGLPNHMLPILGMIPGLGDLMNRATEADEDAKAGVGGVIPRGPDIEAIDPLARLRESIEGQFGREVDEVDRVAGRRSEIQRFLQTVVTGGSR